MLFGWTPAVKLSLCGSAFCCAGKHADRLPIVAAAFLAVLAIFYPGLDGQEEGPAARATLAGYLERRLKSLIESLHNFSRGPMSALRALNAGEFASSSVKSDFERVEKCTESYSICS